MWAKKVALFDKDITAAEQEAGGNQEALEVSLRQVRTAWLCVGSGMLIVFVQALGRLRCANFVVLYVLSVAHNQL